LQVVIYSNNMRNACRGDKDWIVPCSKCKKIKEHI
jgi:hypothetical protein